MMKLMSDDEVDKLKLNNNEADKKKRLRKKKKNSIQKRKMIDKQYLIRKYIHFDLAFSMMNYHQPLLKSLSNLKLFKE